MVKSNRTGYRIQNGECLQRSDQQILDDAKNNKKECRAQCFSPNTSKNTAKNSYKKTKKGDPKTDSALRKKKSNTIKTVRFRTPSPNQEGGKKKRKTRRKRTSSTKRKY
jgi:hypothetical protein